MEQTGSPNSVWGDERLPMRFWSKVRVSANGCWHWTGTRNPDNYGHMSVDSRLLGVHRIAYDQLVGPIPADMQVDHQCHNRSDCAGGRSCEHRACVNPAHLELATRNQNQQRSRNTWSGSAATRTHCVHGHEYTPENTIINRRGRTCRACAYARVTAYEQTERGREVRLATKRRYNERNRVGPRTHCHRGHELTEDNLYHCKGERICKICHKDRAKKWLANNPAAVAKQREATRQWRLRQKQVRDSNA